MYTDMVVVSCGHAHTLVGMGLTANIADSLVAYLLSPSLSLSPLRESVVVAVNQEYIDKEQVIHLKTGDEVAIIPPISGG